MPPPLRFLPYRRTPCLFTLRSYPLSRPRHTSWFHTSPPKHTDNTLPNHYEVLHLTPAATAGEIKRQFYTLSKETHPDRNPDDPTASARFVAVSEAYHVLSVPDKRAQYDAQLHESRHKRSRWGRGEGPAHGSYSSAQSFAGSRPATGLNKKRGTFRGPPPSFYKQGGYGQHGAKRAEYAHHNSTAGQNSENEAGQESYGGSGGFGPGQAGQGHEVPHFDDVRHKRTHQHVHEHISARRRRMRADRPDDVDKSGHLFRFLMVSGVLGTIGLTAQTLTNRNERNNKRTT